MHLPRRRAGWIICCLTKILTGSGCLCLWVPRGHGESWTDQLRTPLILLLASRQQWAVRESHQRLYSSTLCQTMEPGKRAPHTQTPPWPATGQVPVFHLAALPRVRRWSDWSRLYGVWVPGSCPAVSLAPVDSVRPAFSQVQGHPPHSSEGSRCPCLVRGITVLLAKDVMEPVPPADMKAWFFSPYIIVPKKSSGL